jgi:molybdenum cofactor cytidylyltransferase
MPNSKIAAIILAAGESTRMGRLKQVLPWDGVTLIEWQMAQMLAAGVDDVIAVLGHEARQIDEIVRRTPARVVINERYREGRASSVRAGAEAIADDTDAVIILSVDQPRPAWISRRVIDAWRQTAAILVIPAFNGRRGHPILVDGALIDELRGVTEADMGLRSITDRHASEVLIVPIDNSAIYSDLNTPDDFAAASAAFVSGAWAES